jgi:hypothetical protein
MGFSSNFTRVTLGVDKKTGDEALFVEGTTQARPPDDVNDVKEIYVALPQKGVSGSVQDAAGSTDWVAVLPRGASPFAPHEDVVVVGVATRSTTNALFAWQETLEATSRQDV